MPADQLLQVGQKALIAKDDKVLILIDPLKRLDFPGGRLQVGETNLLESLRREVLEETNLKIDQGDPFFTSLIVSTSDNPDAGKNIYIIGFKCKYISGKVTLSEEHNKYQWVDKDNYQEIDDGSDYYKALDK